MGDAIIPKPIFFLKPPSAAACGQCAGDPVRVTVPRGRGSCHYETEVVFRVGPDGAGFDAVTLGLDLTLRDEQNAAKKAGHPWEAAKVKREERGEEEKRRGGGALNPGRWMGPSRSLLSRLVHGFAPCGASAPHMPPHAGALLLSHSIPHTGLPGLCCRRAVGPADRLPRMGARAVQLQPGRADGPIWDGVRHDAGAGTRPGGRPGLVWHRAGRLAVHGHARRCVWVWRGPGSGGRRQKVEGERARPAFPVCSSPPPLNNTRPPGVGPVRPGQSGSLAWGDKVGFQVEFV
jgi:hypothetical protein